jgi:hypothetical protein
MLKQPHTHEFDFFFAPAKLCIEVKHRDQKPQRNNGDPNGNRTCQCSMGDIHDREFDRLILITRYQGRVHMWIVPESVAKNDLMTQTNGGQITYNLTVVRPGKRQQLLDLRRITYKQLHEACLNGALK